MRFSIRKILQIVTLILAACFMIVVYHQNEQNSDGEVEDGVSVNELQHGGLSYLRPKPRERAHRMVMESIQDDESLDYFYKENQGNNHLNDSRIISTENPDPTTNSTFNHIKPTQLDDIFISVKTSQRFHESRLRVILKTWFTLAREQTYFFTDGNDPIMQTYSNGHLINTNCSSTHNRKALCCKMSVEFDTFLEHDKRWFCHFDDDNYVNIPELVQLLKNYNHMEDWYLGKPSIKAPLEIINRADNTPKVAFWFATGGAGFCISRALALKMIPFASGGKFISVGEKIRLPDDVTMGYIIEHLLQKNLTVISSFHSHLEPMSFIKPETFLNQISFSYSRYGKDMNTVVAAGFDHRVDPTRFLSLHCNLFPNFSFCPR